MQFHDFRTTRDLVGNKVPVADFYGTNFTIALAAMNDQRSALQMVSEGMWEKHLRPYYNVYPAIAPMLMRLSLDIDTKFVRPSCIETP